MNVVILGAGKQAELVYYLFAHDTEHEVVAFGIDAEYLDPRNPTLFHLPVVSLDDLPMLYPPGTHLMHVALGDNARRAAAFAHMKHLGYACASYVCSKAQTWPDLQLGENVFIDQGTRIHPFVTVGDNTTLVGTSIGHHATIGAHVLSSCATIGAKTVIGDGSYLGLSCIIREGVRIGKNNIIGAGAFIGQDTEGNAVYSGPKSQKRTVTSSRVAFFNR